MMFLENNKLTFKSISEFRSMKGKPLPIGKWFTVSQEMINDFANATLDKQWIHVDEEKAKKYSSTKTTIAHGFMSISMLSKLLEDVFVINSIKLALNYGLNKVRFPNTVPVNSQLRLISSVDEIEDFNKGIKVTFNCTIEIKGSDKPACVAEFLAVLIE